MVSFKIENTKFNFRAGALIINKAKTKVLLHTIQGYGFYLLPGGRVELMENSLVSLKRELAEELGLVNINPKIIAHTEDFFEFLGVKFHQIDNNYVVYLTEEHAHLEENQKFHGVEGEKYLFEWVDIELIDNYILKPNALKTIIKNHSGNFNHIILSNGSEVID